MPSGTIRFWAAARAAAGVDAEPYTAATLGEALDAVRAAHGPALASVLDRCSFLVDEQPVGRRDPATVALSEGGSVEVLPPFAGGAEAGHALRARAGAALAGGSAGLVAAALAGLAAVGIAALAAGVFAVQVVVVLAWLAALDVRGRGGVFVIAVVAAGGMDALVGTASSPDIGRAAGVVGMSVVAGLLFQLARRPRLDVTVSFAGTVSAVTFALCAASYVALRVERGGDRADVAALLGAGAALAVARAVDIAVPHPVVVPGSRRGAAGVVLGAAVAALVGWALGTDGAIVGPGDGLRLALVAAVVALVADLAVDAVLTAAPPRDARARSAVAPLGILLPVVLAGPAAYVAGRILLG